MGCGGFGGEVVFGEGSFGWGAGEDFVAWLELLDGGARCEDYARGVVAEGIGESGWLSVDL